jgi:hypothetical protein
MMKKLVKKAGEKKQAKAKMGNKYVCGLCGMSVTVDEPCSCTDKCDIICCGTQMVRKTK